MIRYDVVCLYTRSIRSYHEKIRQAFSSPAGMVIYQPILPEPVTVYKVWGCDEKGNLIKDKGQDFFLTNS